jgi:hypothetical protein
VCAYERMGLLPIDSPGRKTAIPKVDKCFTSSLRLTYCA